MSESRRIKRSCVLVSRLWQSSMLGGLVLGIAIVGFLVFAVTTAEAAVTAARRPETQDRLDLTRTALAATENLEMVQADQSWSSLFQRIASRPLPSR